MRLCSLVASPSAKRVLSLSKGSGQAATKDKYPTRAALVCVLLAGCAPNAPLLEPIEGPKLRTLEGAYDRAKWRWVRNADGRALLTHTELASCFVQPEPPLDPHEDGLTVKRGEKTIRGTRYQVVSVYEKEDFWEAVYMRAGSTMPMLSVYAAGRCQQEGERILERYEQSLAERGRAGTK
jgi:hypothetical protein